MSPNTNCYLDYYQSRDTANEPLSIGGYLPVEKTYSLDPYDKLSDEERKYILGVQGNLWTEYISEYDHAQYMALPRLSAIAEVGWSYPNKNYESFVKRLHHCSTITVTITASMPLPTTRPPPKITDYLIYFKCL